jgi:thymidylate kinase
MVNMNKNKITKIIIEGPDCSGKSTVVDRVKNMLRWDSKSLHHKPGNQFQRYLKEYALNNNIVFDRSHFSEIVYSILWREGNPFSKKENHILDEICSHNTLIIFTCPPLHTLRERYSNRNFKQQIKLQELEKSRKLFIKTLKNTHHILYLSNDYYELDNLLKKVKEIMK